VFGRDVSPDAKAAKKLALEFPSKITQAAGATVTVSPRFCSRFILRGRICPAFKVEHPATRFHKRWR
jgi:hypothetical protein